MYKEEFEREFKEVKKHIPQIFLGHEIDYLNVILKVDDYKFNTGLKEDFVALYYKRRLIGLVSLKVIMGIIEK